MEAAYLQHCKTTAQHEELVVYGSAQTIQKSLAVCGVAVKSVRLVSGKPAFESHLGLVTLSPPSPAFLGCEGKLEER